jgi:hypothetical protein
VLAYVRFETVRTLRNPGFLVLVTIVPIALYLVGVRGVSAGEQIGGVPASVWYLASSAALGAIGAAISGSGARLAAERASGWARQLRVTPLIEASWLVGRILSSLLVIIPVVVFVAILAITVGEVRLEAGQWLGLTATLVIGSIPIALIGSSWVLRSARSQHRPLRRSSSSCSRFWAACSLSPSHRLEPCGSSCRRPPRTISSYSHGARSAGKATSRVRSSPSLSSQSSSGRLPSSSIEDPPEVATSQLSSIPRWSAYRAATLAPVRPMPGENLGPLAQHPHEHRPQRPILLAVDEELTEGASRASLASLDVSSATSVRDHWVEVPAVWDAFEFVNAPVLEKESIARHEILDGGRHMSNPST